MRENPIILVGMQRSGTTWLGEAFSLCRSLAYWVEPRHVWSWGHWLRGDDRLTARDASPLVRWHIRRTFERYVRAHGAQRLCEKTPSNCLRLSFVRAVYPEARIILILRDGRAVLRSTEEQRQHGPEWGRVLTRIRETPVWEWPAYITRASGLFAKLTGKPLSIWGVRPPGWREWVANDSPSEIIAKQWAASVECAVEEGRSMDPESYTEVRFEELMTKPRETIERLIDFAGLAGAKPVVDHVVKTADSDRVNKWKDELSPETLAMARPHMAPLMERLGYAW